MLETNIRIVHPGMNLFVRTRRIGVTGTDLSPDLLQRACSRLKYKHGLAAVPVANEQSTLLVATSHRLSHPIKINGDEWALELKDTDEPGQILRLSDPENVVLLPQLIERAFLATLAGRDDLWVISRQPRHWYEQEPFDVQKGIAAYHRYEVAGMFIEDVGIGMAVDVNTSFFTSDSLAYYFDPNISVAERDRREATVNRFLGRQKGQKGTLLYDNGRTLVKCYFEAAPAGTTCATTGPVIVKGKKFDSLIAYYRDEYPNLPVSDSDVAIKVSFPGLKKPVWVAAKQVWARIANDFLPGSLSQVDKIRPEERRKLILSLWQKLGDHPFGRQLPGVQSGFWRPSDTHIQQLPLPDLTVGKGEILKAPTEISVAAYEAHFQRRAEYLEELGCYHVPPTMARKLYFAYPKGTNAKACQQLMDDMIAQVSARTRCSIEAVPVEYNTVADAAEQLLKYDTSGTLVFVLNHESSAYYEIAICLDGWRIKRITTDTLLEKHQLFETGVWIHKFRRYDLKKGKSKWYSFIEKNVLAVLQLLDAIPYRVKQAGPYEAQLVIDVGYDRRHFGLSLLIARDSDKQPGFWIDSQVYSKQDLQKEEINPVILADKIVEMFDAIPFHNFVPLNSILSIRDGGFCGDEHKAVEDAFQRLTTKGKLAINARDDRVDLHKDTQKTVRLWDTDDKSGNVENALEGQLLRIKKGIVVLTTTGAATLPQGTAKPLMLVGNGHCNNVADSALAFFDSAQHNWSSPQVAQRLAITVKRTDDDLISRTGLEIKRWR